MSNLVKPSTEWHWRGPFETKDIPKKAGFRWDPARKIWWTKFPDVALKLIDYAEGVVREELGNYLKKKIDTLRQSQATSSEIDIPAPNGLSYMPFQKAGIAYALTRANTLIGDDMGLGKTIQAIGVINSLPEINRVLVVCPAALKQNWANELRKWATRPLTIGIVASDYFPQTQILIINYDILAKHESQLKIQEWDLLIVDEAHRCKNPDAIRTQQILGKKDKFGNFVLPSIAAKRKIFLTGTPIVNRPIELFGIANSLAPETFPSFWDYAKRYCNATEGKWGWDFSGASNLDELQEKLRSSIMVRRLKSEVLAELPAKIRQVIEIPANGLKELIKHETEEIETWKNKIALLKGAVELANDTEYKDAVKKLREGTQSAFTEMAKLRHDTSVAKIPYVIDHLEDVLESGKVVVFAHHHDVVHALANRFSKVAVVLTGETKMEDRQAIVEKFQTDSNIKLFIGSITAAGVGITLTSASHVVFVELDWVPGNVTQAEDRCHRIGQKNSVLIQHLVLEGSLDARIAKTIVAKQDVISKVINLDIDNVI